MEHPDEVERRPTVLLLSPHPISNDARFKRHIRALNPRIDLVSCTPGPSPAHVTAHVQLPSSATILARTPRMLGNLAVRQFAAAYSASPLVGAVKEVFDGGGPSFDAVLCSDLELVPVACEIAGARPVVVDLREYYPTQFDSDWRWRLMLKPLMQYLATEHLPHVDAAITVSPGIVALYQANFNIEASLVTNAAFGRNPQPTATGSPIRIVHSGGAIPGRQIEVMIEAASDLPRIILDLVLFSPPQLGRYRERLTQLAMTTTNVRVLDAVPQDELPALHDSYDVGLSVFPTANPQLNFTLPNKFFDYLQSGLVIVAGPGVDMARISRQHCIGPLLETFDVKSLRALLSSLTEQEIDTWKAASCNAATKITGEEQGKTLISVMQRSLAHAPADVDR